MNKKSFKALRQKEETFLGFFDLTGNGEKEIVFGGDGLAILDAEADHIGFQLGPNFQFLGVMDYNGDKKMDIVVGNKRKKEVQVLGIEMKN